MDTPQLNSERAIGRLEGQLSVINQSLIKMAAELELGEKDGARHREDVNRILMDVTKSLSGLTSEIGELRPAVHRLQADMNEVMPIARQITKWRTMGAGIIVILTLLGAVFSETLIRAKDKIIAIIFGA